MNFRRSLPEIRCLSQGFRRTNSLPLTVPLSDKNVLLATEIGG